MTLLKVFFKNLLTPLKGLSKLRVEEYATIAEAAMFNKMPRLMLTHTLIGNKNWQNTSQYFKDTGAFNRSIAESLFGEALAESDRMNDFLIEFSKKTGKLSFSENLLESLGRE